MKGTAVTEGFDSATPQAGLNFEAAVQAGREFVFVKATGGNVGLYIAPHYVEQLTAARTAGLHVGHTHLTGRAGTPTEQAHYFVGNLHAFNVGRDGLALDNERFPDEPGSCMWNDGQVAEFWAAVFRLLPALPKTRGYTYGDASHLGALGPWTKTAATGAKRAWCAAYHANDGTRGATPTVPGLTVAIHQYTSVGTLGGKHPVDLDWSPLTVRDLFPPIPAPAPLPVPVPAPPVAPTPAVHTTAEHPIGDDMPPCYFKGDQRHDVYILNRLTGTKRHITAAEWAAAGHGLSAIVIPQADADQIPLG